MRKGAVDSMIKVMIMIFLIVAIFITMWMIGEKIIINTVKSIFM